MGLCLALAVALPVVTGMLLSRMYLGTLDAG